MSSNLRQKNSKCVLGGWLEKRGAIRKNWKKRWFELFGDKFLRYSRDSDSQTPIGIISLSQVLSIGRTTVKKNQARPYCFDIATPNRVWTLAAKDDQSRDKWLNALQQVIGIKLAILKTVKEGKLLKKGRVNKNWKWRYFCVVSGVLCYFIDEESSIGFKSVAGRSQQRFRKALEETRGFVVLHGATVRKIGDFDSQNFVFSISAASGRVYHLASASASELNDWVACVQAQSEVTSPHFDKEYHDVFETHSDEEDVIRQRTVSQDSRFQNLTTMELRKQCAQYQISPKGDRDELVGRIIKFEAEAKQQKRRRTTRGESPKNSPRSAKGGKVSPNGASPEQPRPVLKEQLDNLMKAVETEQLRQRSQKEPKMKRRPDGSLPIARTPYSSFSSTSSDGPDVNGADLAKAANRIFDNMKKDGSSDPKVVTRTPHPSMSEASSDEPNFDGIPERPNAFDDSNLAKDTGNKKQDDALKTHTPTITLTEENLKKHLKSNLGQLSAKLAKINTNQVGGRTSISGTSASASMTDVSMMSINVQAGRDSPRSVESSSSFGSDGSYFKSFKAIRNPKDTSRIQNALRKTGRKEGWLLRKLRFGNWKQRYYVLMDGHLSFFKSTQDDYPDGSFSLRGWVLEIPKMKYSKGFSFKLSCKEFDQDFLFVAQNETLRNDWVEQIEQAIESSGPLGGQFMATPRASEVDDAEFPLPELLPPRTKTRTKTRTPFPSIVDGDDPTKMRQKQFHAKLTTLIESVEAVVGEIPAELPIRKPHRRDDSRDVKIRDLTEANIVLKQQTDSIVREKRETEQKLQEKDQEIKNTQDKLKSMEAEIEKLRTELVGNAGRLSQESGKLVSEDDEDVPALQTQESGPTEPAQEFEPIPERVQRGSITSFQNDNGEHDSEEEFEIIPTRTQSDSVISVSDEDWIKQIDQHHEVIHLSGRYVPHPPKGPKPEYARKNSSARQDHAPKPHQKKSANQGGLQSIPEKELKEPDQHKEEVTDMKQVADEEPLGGEPKDKGSEKAPETEGQESPQKGGDLLGKEEVKPEEAPKEEATKEEPPKEEPPKEEPPKEELPKEELPKEELPKEELPKDELPAEESPKEEHPKEEQPKEEQPKEEQPKEELPKEENSLVNLESKPEHEPKPQPEPQTQQTESKPEPEPKSELKPEPEPVPESKHQHVDLYGDDPPGNYDGGSYNAAIPPPSWTSGIDLYGTGEFDDKEVAGPVVPEEEPMDDSEWYFAAPKDFADCDELIESSTYCLETLELAASRRKSMDHMAVREAHKKLCDDLQAMVFIVFGDEDIQVDFELADKLVHTNLLHTELFRRIVLRVIRLKLLDEMKKIQFESQKHLAKLFKYMFRERTREIAVEYVEDRPEILAVVMEGCNDPESYIACGNILRNCIRRNPLCRILQETELFDRFFDIVRHRDFDIATDGFSSLKMLLTKHPEVCAEFMLSNYETVVKEKLNSLTKTRNYVNKRLALSLLSDLLTSRPNFHLMIKYVNDSENLELMISLLRDKKKAVQTQAYDVFKIFVANPRKSEEVLEMLTQCKKMLTRFMGKFQQTKRNDPRFEQECQMIMGVLQGL